MENELVTKETTSNISQMGSSSARSEGPNMCKRAYHILFRPLIAEFIGGLFHVLISILTGISSHVLITALGAGFSLYVAISISCNISGGHINPAVTLGVFLNGGIAFDVMIAYFVSQLLGGITAAGIAKSLVNETRLPVSWATVNFNKEYQTEQQAVIIEILLTSCLLLTVYKTMADLDFDGKTLFGPLLIGIYVSAAVIAAGPLSGAGINPARCFGAAVVFSDFNSLWIYFVGPFSGATLAAILNRLVLANHKVPSVRWLALKMIKPSYVEAEEL